MGGDGSYRKILLFHTNAFKACSCLKHSSFLKVNVRSFQANVFKACVCLKHSNFFKVNAIEFPQLDAVFSSSTCVTSQWLIKNGAWKKMMCSETLIERRHQGWMTKKSLKASIIFHATCSRGMLNSTLTTDIAKICHKMVLLQDAGFQASISQIGIHWCFSTGLGNHLITHQLVELGWLVLLAIVDVFGVGIHHQSLQKLLNQHHTLIDNLRFGDTKRGNTVSPQKTLAGEIPFPH